MSILHRKIDQLGRVFDKVIETNLLYHIIFWLVFYFFLIVLAQNTLALSQNMLINFLKVFFYGAIVYINLLYLFPKFLASSKFLLYMLLLSATVIVLTLIEIAAIKVMTSNTEPLQSYVINLGHSIFITSFFMACSSSIYKIISDWFLHQREKLDLQRQSLKSELKYLKAQINPHFLFNTLNSLYALTLKKSDLAPEIVLRLSEMMRYMLYECNEKSVPLEKEINYLQNYLELEKIRHANKFQIEFVLDGEIRNQRIAPLLFIPFIENSFKHGLNNQANNGHVKINIRVNPEMIHLDIENSKSPTMPAQHHRKSGGIGLVNVHKRLDLIYPNEHDLKITDTPNSYKIDLQINLN